MAANLHAVRNEAAQLEELQREFRTYILNADVSLIKELSHKTLFPLFQKWEKLPIVQQEPFRAWVKQQGSAQEAQFNACLNLFEEREYKNFVLPDLEDDASDSSDDEFMQELRATQVPVTPPHTPGMFETITTRVGLGSLFGYGQQPQTPPLSPQHISPRTPPNTTPPGSIARKRLRPEDYAAQHEDMDAEQNLSRHPGPPPAYDAAEQEAAERERLAQQEREATAKREAEERERLRLKQEQEAAAERERLAQQEREATAKREAEEHERLRLKQEQEAAAERERLAQQEREATAKREAEEHERLRLKQEQEAAAKREAEERERQEQERLRVERERQEQARIAAAQKAAEDLKRQQEEQKRQAELLLKQQQEAAARQAAAAAAAAYEAKKQAALKYMRENGF